MSFLLAAVAIALVAAVMALAREVRLRRAVERLRQDNRASLTVVAKRIFGDIIPSDGGHQA